MTETNRVELPRLVVIMPALNQYRQGFYDRLDVRLRAEGLRLEVVSNRPPPSLAARRDGTTGAWAVPQHVQWLKVAGKEVAIRHPSELKLRKCDLVVVQQALGNLDTYPLLLRQHFGGSSVAMWGHGATYGFTPGRFHSVAKRWLTNRSDWFFAYTTAGAHSVVRDGFPVDRVTVVGNTIDTDELSTSLSSIREEEVRRFRAANGLTQGRTALFLGGVDSRKGIDFLLETARTTERSLPGFVLLVAGAGAALSEVKAAAEMTPAIRVLGRLEGREKALALKSCDILAIPEWIGLVAVDALVAGRPVVATIHHSHSPEKEYLIDGYTAKFADHTVEDYSSAIASVLRSAALQTMQINCLSAAEGHSIGRMVDNFCDGLRAWRGLRV